MPNLTSPRVCQFPEGAVASLAGLNKLLFWDLILVNQWAIGQDRPYRLKRGPMVLPTSLFKGRQRLLKSDQYILVYGVPKWRPRPIFPLIII